MAGKYIRSFGQKRNPETMKYLKGISAVLLLAIILVLAIWLLLKGRGYHAANHSGDFAYFKEQKRIRDSADKAANVKDHKNKADSTVQQWKIDSLNNRLAVTNKLLSKSQAKAADLAAGVEQARKENDTLKYVFNCNGLAEEVFTLNHQVNNFKIQVDTLIRAKDSLQVLTQKRLDEKSQLYSDMRAAQNAADKTIEKIEADYKKAAGKAEKKYVVIIGGGPCITNEGKPGGAAGIFIGRTVIRL